MREQKGEAFDEDDFGERAGYRERFDGASASFRAKQRSVKKCTRLVHQAQCPKWPNGRPHCTMVRGMMETAMNADIRACVANGGKL